MARRTGRTKSDLIREAVQQMTANWAEGSEKGQTAYDWLADIIGIVDRGPGDRAVRGEEILREKFARKRPLR
jgi:hypothetical protein